MSWVFSQSVPLFFVSPTCTACRTTRYEETRCTKSLPSFSAIVVRADRYYVPIVGGCTLVGGDIDSDFGR